MPANKKKDEPDQDPYDLLGVEFGASDAAITKAYRKLALKLHPDKQKGSSEKELERIAKEFHDVNEARAFLLDAESKDARAKYDAKRASIKRRREADAQRERGLSDRRKRMREDLKQQEELARQQQQSTSSSRGRTHEQRAHQEKLDKLRKEGHQAREAYAQQKARESAAAETSASQSTAVNDRQQRQWNLESRQVRLKWSRKKISTSPSEHSLAATMSTFGTVEEVELLGSKGNTALITFADPASCRPCVEAYKTSDQMRAHFVGRRKEEEELREAAAEQQEYEAGSSRHDDARRDKESLQERQLRQQAERERLMREMQAEETGQSTAAESTHHRPPSAAKDAVQNLSERANVVQFPATEEYRHLSPLQKLQLAEQKILGEILSLEDMRRLQQTHE